jgi:molybdenum cofactor cytidylyltransferase
MSIQKNDNKNFAVILLAAGKSSRLGHPKQLLLYDGQTLLQHSLQVASASNANPIVVVLGAQADIIKKEIDQAEAHIVVNADWQEGMASSIRSGVKHLVQIFPSVEGAILMVCDQPYVTSSLLNDLIATHQNTGKPIVTCGYANTFGPPTLFHKSLFPELLQLKADVGARGILRQHTDQAEVILFPEGSLDIDTEADYQKLSKDKRES